MLRVAQIHGRHILKAASRQANGRAGTAILGHGFESRHAAPPLCFSNPTSGDGK